MCSLTCPFSFTGHLPQRSRTEHSRQEAKSPLWNTAKDGEGQPYVSWLACHIRYGLGYRIGRTLPGAVIEGLVLEPYQWRIRPIPARSEAVTRNMGVTKDVASLFISKLLAGKAPKLSVFY